MKTSQTLKKFSGFCMYALGIMLLITSCKADKKFDRAKWDIKNDMGVYLYREEMLNDLMHHHQLKGLSYHEILNVLGKPENRSHQSSNKIFYNVLKEFGHDIVPSHTRSLVIMMNSDSVVTEIGIEEMRQD